MFLLEIELPQTLVLWVLLLVRIVCLAFVVVSIYLTYTVLHPTIIPYPWPARTSQNKNKLRASSTSQNKNKLKASSFAKRQTLAVYAGSFNPPHKGHLSILKYLSTRFDKVVVAIGMNPDKTYDVTPHDRAAMVTKMLLAEDDDTTSDTTNIEVHVVIGYIWRFVKTQFPSRKFSNTSFIRGIRTMEADYADEQFLHILNTFGPLLVGPFVWPISTIIIMGDPGFNHVSSSLVRKIIGQVKSGKRTPSSEGVSSSNSDEALSDNESRVLAESLGKLVPQSIVSQVAQAYGGVSE
jgi:pantetheine-phosphate adenylyltransferase